GRELWFCVSLLRACSRPNSCTVARSLVVIQLALLNAEVLLILSFCVMICILGIVITYSGGLIIVRNVHLNEWKRWLSKFDM
uniref:NADH dehydrogenase subunit 4L n=1 Tax=Parascaris equorum TaxID=6256 RepID=A0A914RWR1_PAREQ